MFFLMKAFDLHCLWSKYFWYIQLCQHKNNYSLYAYF